ncbi:isoprenyl transferase [Desulfococcaceae bacterium HSG7]|nr:isoprenyl transferase [Desulfococcaceae bacterium HSG7]
MNSDSADKKNTSLDKTKLPAHVAIIMDGNGRWAQKKLLNRVKGHARGVETVRNIVEASREIGISYLTLYAFSTENWQRPKAEIAALMRILKKFLKSELNRMQENNIRLNTIGQTERLPPDVKSTLQKTITATQNNDGMLLTLALSYGARTEITQAMRAIAQKAYERTIDPGSLSDSQMTDLISEHLYTSKIPDPELLIRTSGEMRISNFLLWQIAYSELYITPTLWPDFSENEYLKILTQFQHRERRFGKV